jgi:hypothetical protein
MRSPILCAATHKIVGGCYHSYVDKYLSTHFLLLSLHASDDGIVRLYSQDVSQQLKENYKKNIDVVWLSH